jgi:hypothetical protein
MAIHAEFEKVRQVFMHIESVEQGGRYVHVIDEKSVTAIVNSRPANLCDQAVPFAGLDKVRPANL